MNRDLEHFTKLLITTARLYPGFVMQRETVKAYWDYLHGTCAIPFEALRKGIEQIPKMHPKFFPTAAEVENIAMPFVKAMADVMEAAQRAQARSALPLSKQAAMEGLLRGLAAIDTSRPAADVRAPLERALQLLSVALHGSPADDVYVRNVLDLWTTKGYATRNLVKAIANAGDYFTHLPTLGGWGRILSGRDLGIDKYYGFTRDAVPIEVPCDPYFKAMAERWEAENLALGLTGDEPEGDPTVQAIGRVRIRELVDALVNRIGGKDLRDRGKSPTSEVSHEPKES